MTRACKRIPLRRLSIRRDPEVWLALIILLLAVARAHWWAVVPDQHDGIVGGLAFWLQPDRIALGWAVIAVLILVALAVRRWRARLLRACTSAAVGILLGLAASLAQAMTGEAWRHASSNVSVALLIMLATSLLSPRAIEADDDSGGPDES